MVTSLDATARAGAPAGRPAEVHLFWFAGMSCDGCTVAATGAATPRLERMLTGTVLGMPRVVLHHPFFSPESGADFLRDHRRAARAELEAPYIVVLEGSATDEDLAGEGFFAALGSGTVDDPGGNRVDGVAQPLRTMDWIRALAPRATACVAVGTCASWGGVPAAHGNVTGARSLGDLLGAGYRSRLGLPVVNIPGCAPVGDNIAETIGALLLHLEGIGPVPALDDLGRPEWLFSETVHRTCSRAGFYEEGRFVDGPGGKECLIEAGCWGAVVQCNMSTRGAINGMGGCMEAGGACIGCTMPGFPDRFTPFLTPLPASMIATDRTLEQPAPARRAGTANRPFLTEEGARRLGAAGPAGEAEGRRGAA